MSIQAPIWQRKIWGGTKPLDLSIDCALVAAGNAKTDVYEPVYRLCQALLPRRVTAGMAGEINKALNLKGIFEFMQAPGPSPMSPTGAGDIVQVAVGNLITMNTCYLKSVRGRFSKSLDQNGYPLAAMLQVSFSAVQNSVFVDDEVNNAFNVMVSGDALSDFRTFLIQLNSKITSMVPK
jgi:hypothetical protein